ncbi:hypothetical protein [Arthrobacter crystallopoietes]|uniref:Uncharacterized protein n=1 Tax=Crystallibacter crystallopoietes TaxID=37928 RepID=A0A1H1HVS2_9MICC|nr:hypothetical protein [Arthrobacter crystallopoietes]AUI53784.1 hypothetical protein AC20117_22850 [Arthrobacter crystallopoietes]SDR29409.1 hypothetical protein SAMN04489742_4698 [Arthrobacter crystallopoietes]
MANLSIEKTQEQARRLLDSRIASVTGLVTAKQRVADLKDQLAEAERDSKKAYVRATKDGWTPEELKKLGLENQAAAKRNTARRNQTETPVAQQAFDGSLPA